MKVRILINFETATKQLQMERPKDLALSIEVLALAMAGLGAHDVKSLQGRSGSSSVSESRIITP